MTIFKTRHIKQLLLVNLITIVGFIIIFTAIKINENYKYKKEINNIISNIIEKVSIKYPNITEEEIIELVNYKGKSDILKKYGYDEETVIVKSLQKDINKNIIVNNILIIVLSLLFIVSFLIYIVRYNKRINLINRYIEEINKRNYELVIEDNSEDDLSALQNSLYKLVTMLKHTSDVSIKEKEALKISVEDISHQLKTPLTSILIMLDNLKDDDIEEEVKQDFINDITKQIEWINSLIVSLLKISKFDAGVMVLKNEKISTKKLIDTVINNLAVLIDLKNISIDVIGNDCFFMGDFKWQSEAITNIVKNAIEHSEDNKKITISYNSNSIYTKISIKDEGIGIDKEDVKHIFERFYKSKTAKENSIGIGLSLAKSIIEKGNGYITCDSEENIGTIFEIKYFKQ